MYKIIEENINDVTKPKYKLILRLLCVNFTIAHFYVKIDADNVAFLLNKQKWVKDNGES